ncbi:MAG: hypothetical protein ACREMY_28325, partial [bacterium]
HQSDARIVRPFEGFASDNGRVVVTIGLHESTPVMNPSTSEQEQIYHSWRSQRQEEIIISVVAK